MRVIAGSARRLRLTTIEGLDTRPTTDRIKETLFNMLHNDLAGCRFLDLFAGSGGIGIEALSRGAREAVFVEKNPKAAACIRENLTFTRLSDRARVMETDVFAALPRLEDGSAFDYIFMDPPYDHGLEQQVIRWLDHSSLADLDTVIIFEASIATDIRWLSSMGWRIIKVKQYKTNQHIFTAKGES